MYREKRSSLQLSRERQLIEPCPVMLVTLKDRMQYFFGRERLGEGWIRRHWDGMLSP